MEKNKYPLPNKKRGYQLETLEDKQKNQSLNKYLDKKVKVLIKKK